jgi:hypothetical protein
MSATIKTSWKKTPMNTTITFSVSPIPNHRIQKGSKAGTGKYLIKLVKGLRRASTDLKHPIKIPIGIAIKTETIKPSSILKTLILISPKKSCIVKSVVAAL